MRGRGSWLGGLLALGLLIAGCSGGEDEAATAAPVLSVFGAEDSGDEEGSIEASGAADEAPTVLRVDFEPKKPASGERLRARVEVEGTWTSLRYEWQHNGQTFGSNTSEVVLPTVSSGDRIVVRVTPHRGSLRGPTFEAGRQVLNQKPLVRNLSLERAAPDGLDEVEGDHWRVVALVEDPDDDDVEIEYRWWLNGQESEVEDAFYPVGELKRGDRLEVEVRASDGQLFSAPTRSGEIEVGNAPPAIVSVPPRPDDSGYFEYTIRAEDPDGDPNLRFALISAPRGMQIDEVEGIVTWRPSPDQTGRHSVELAVRDGAGGETTQSFSLALIGVTASDAPGPAAVR